MDNQPVQNQVSEPIHTPVQVPQQKPKFPVMYLVLSVFILLFLASTAFLYYQNMQLKNMLASYQTPAASPSPSTTPDPPADWKVYTNSIQKISFKYPSTWTLDSDGDQEQLNAQLSLTKDQAKIKMYFSMDGIGGQGQTYEGQPFVLDENSLYRFVKTNSYDNTQMVGISTTLTNTLGVFEINGKTYSITLAYPVAEVQKPTGIMFEKEFDQILSTFKFTNALTTNERNVVENFVKARVFDYGKSHGLTSENQIIVRIDYLSDNLAAGGIGFTPDVEGSGEAWYAAKINGQWTMVLETQQPPTCKIMIQYGFPKSFYGECITE
jgi:hypothetical protein